MNDRAISYHETMAAVGSVFFLWSEVERALAQGILLTTPEGGLRTAHTITGKIQLWRDLQACVSKLRPEHERLVEEICTRLMPALELRNLIAHGLLGGSADDPESGNSAGLYTDLNGKTRNYSYDEIQEILRSLSHICRAIEVMSKAATEPDTEKASHLLAGICLNRLAPG